MLSSDHMKLARPMRLELTMLDQREDSRIAARLSCDLLMNNNNEEPSVHTWMQCMPPFTPREGRGATKKR